MALTIIYANPGLPVQYVLDENPTTFSWGGTNAEVNSVLYRTDTRIIYFKTGPLATDWTPQANTGISGITLLENAVVVPGGPHTTFSFVGPGIDVSNIGAGAAQFESGNDVLDEGAPIGAGKYAIFNFVGTGILAEDAGGGEAQIRVPSMGVLVFGAVDITAAADTRFLAPGTIATAVTTNIFQVTVPFDCLAKNMFVRHNTANGDGDSVVYTLMVNGAAVALAVTLATGAIGGGSETVTAVALTAGDEVAIRATKAADITNGVLNVQVTIQLGG